MGGGQTLPNNPSLGSAPSHFATAAFKGDNGTYHTGITYIDTSGNLTWAYSSGLPSLTGTNAPTAYQKVGSIPADVQTPARKVTVVAYHSNGHADRANQVSLQGFLQNTYMRWKSLHK
jgi:hypothetical protein